MPTGVDMVVYMFVDMVVYHVCCLYLSAPDDSLVPEVQGSDVNKADSGNHEGGKKEAEDQVTVNGDVAMEGEGKQTEHEENAEEGT